jgi:hypothetical protein
MAEENPTRRDVVRQASGAAVSGLAVSVTASGAAAADGETVDMDDVRRGLREHDNGLIDRLRSKGLITGISEFSTPRQADLPGGGVHLTAETTVDGKQMTIHVDAEEDRTYAVMYEGDDVKVYRADGTTEAVRPDDHNLLCNCNEDEECYQRGGQLYCCQKEDGCWCTCWWGRCC